MTNGYWARNLNRRISRRGLLASAAGAAILAACSGKSDPNDAPPAWVSVKRFGAKGNGEADDTAAINRAISQVAFAGGGTVLLPRGTYRVAGSPGIVLQDRVHLTGEGPGAVTIVQEVWRDSLIEAAGTIPTSDLAALSANALPGERTLQLSSNNGIEEDDYLLLGADAMFSDPPDDTSGDLVRYRGEVVRVLSVDPGNQVTLHGMVRDVYRTADSAGVRKISYLTGVGIENLHILNPEPGKHVGSMVALRGVRDFVVDNVSMDGADGIGLRLDHCLDGQVTRIRARDFDDDTASGRLGYGLAVMRATENVIVSNCHWQNMRHAVTTGGRNNERGVPRNVMITDCSADLMSDYAFDTHVQGSGITFNSCSVTNSRRGGFHIRSPDTHVMQCQVNWSPVGVSVERCGHGSSVKGGVMRHLIRTEDIGGHGLHVRRARRVLFDGVTVDGCSQNAVWQGAGTDETIIRNLTVINPNVDGVSRPAIFQESGGAFAGTVIDNNMIRAYSESTPEPLSSGRMSHGIEMSSRATGYEVTRNSVRGHNGSVVQTNGSSGLVSDNVDLDRA